MQLYPKTVRAILKFVLKHIDFTKTRILRDPGDSLKRDTFFSLIAEHLKKITDFELDHFDFSGYLKYLSRNNTLDETVHDTLGDIVKLAFSRINTEITPSLIKWSKKVKEVALQLKSVDISSVEDNEQFTVFKELIENAGAYDSDLGATINLLLELGKKIILADHNEMNTVAISTMLGPCFFNVIFNQGENLKDKSLMSQMFQLFERVIRSIYSDIFIRARLKSRSEPLLFKQSSSLTATSSLPALSRSDNNLSSSPGNLNLPNNPLFLTSLQALSLSSKLDDKEKEILIIQLISKGDLEALRGYLDKRNINMIRGALDRTPLHLAVLKQFDHLIKYFLSLEINITIKDRSGKTAVHLMVEKGNASAIEMVFRCGALNQVITISDSQGMTPLHTLAQVKLSEWNEHHDSILMLLTKAQASFFAKNSEKKSPLMLSEENGTHEKFIRAMNERPSAPTSAAATIPHVQPLF